MAVFDSFTVVSLFVCVLVCLSLGVKGRCLICDSGIFTLYAELQGLLFNFISQCNKIVPGLWSKLYCLNVCFLLT